MGDMLYKYTTLESLALILQSKKLRLNPLTLMDDLQEAEHADGIQYGKYVFISSWMDQPMESIAMWKLYSNMQSGVRIGMSRYPFEKYAVAAQEVDNFFGQKNKNSENIEMIAPLEKCFGDKYMILNFLYDKCLEKIEYTDDPQKLSPKMFDIRKEGLNIRTNNLGKYKNSYWEFQNEERYILRFLPTDVKTIISATSAAQVVYDALINTSDFLPYYDLDLSNQAFSSMEVTMSPQFSKGNKIMLETLREKYNPDMCIVESALKDKIRIS